MKQRFWLPVRTGLLSYSAMSKFQECPRRYAFSYIDKPDLPDEPEGRGLLRGRAFHTAVENNDHTNLGKDHGLDHVNYVLVRAAAKRYLIMQKAGNLPNAKYQEQKIINEEEQFFGKVDNMDVDEDSGLWTLGEMKTGKFDPTAYALAETRPQTALYKAMSKQFCSDNFLSHKDFAGLNYIHVDFPNVKPHAFKPAPKSGKNKGIERPAESVEDFELRAFDQTRILHQVLKVRDETVKSAVNDFRYTLAAIDHLGPNSNRYPKHCNACKHPFFGLCEYAEICHGMKLFLTDDAPVTLDVDCEDVP
jgi:hypothetical protein